MDFPAVCPKVDRLIHCAPGQLSFIIQGGIFCHLSGILERNIISLHRNNIRIQLAHIDDITAEAVGLKQRPRSRIEPRQLLCGQIAGGKIKTPHINLRPVTNQNTVGIDNIDTAAPGQRSQNIRTSVTSDIVQIIVTVKGHLSPTANGKAHPLDDIIVCRAGDIPARFTRRLNRYRCPLCVQHR